MKSTSQLRTLLLIIPLLLFHIAQAQTSIEGYVFDKKTKEPLPYAAILIGNTGVYTSSNEDGKFKVTIRTGIDSLEFRYVGYKTRKVSKDYFNTNDRLYMEISFTVLSEVVIRSKKKNAETELQNTTNSNTKTLHELLYAIIKKYRNSDEESQSKAYFTLNSIAYANLNESSTAIPLEHIEAFYSSKQKLSRGITYLNLKTGRFGQNRETPFYSLYHVSLIQNFLLFKKETSFLPQHIGNMSASRLKNRYYLNLEENENYNGTVISFAPKKNKKDIFSGKIYFKASDSIIEKISFSIDNPEISRLKTLNRNGTVAINTLELNILFSPVDYSKIQYVDFKLDLNHTIRNIRRNIISKSILYLYDNNTEFSKPYFTDPINFENDYAKLLALPVSDSIWQQKYPFPRSKKSMAIIDFFKEKNTSYDYFKNQIPPYAIKYIKTSTILWNSDRKLNFDDIKEGLGINLDFSYSLNAYEKATDDHSFTVNTLFNTKTSFLNANRTPRDLECINLAFDIYELHRHYLVAKIKNVNSVEAAKALCDKVNADAKVTVRAMLKEAFYKKNNDNLSRWKHKIQQELKKYNSY